MVIYKKLALMKKTTSRRINAMKNITTKFEPPDEEIFAFDVSDEALEIAAGTKEKANFTLGACSGLSVCPGEPA